MRTALVVTLLGLSGASVLADDGAAVEVQLRDGLATPTHFHVSGRVLRLDRRALVREKLTRMLGQPGRMLDAMDTDDAESIHVRIAVDGTTYSATTDDDGTFDLDVEGLRTALPVGVLPIKVTLASPGVVLQRGGEGVLHVFAERGVLVVSDVDDTIVQTFVTEKRRAVKQVLTKGEDTLDAVPGAPAAYQHARAAGAAGFVYLSGSPQNLYPRVHGYLAHLQIPAGPLLLKNVGGTQESQGKGQRAEFSPYAGFKLDSPFAIQFFAAWQDQKDLPYEINSWARQVLSRDYEGAAHLWSVVEPKLPEGFRQTAETAWVYLLWKLALPQSFVDSWMTLLAQPEYASSRISQALMYGSWT